eukprot:CAMPEP_0118855604 /NCGR_PEP_ID=MMETSP1163-20130328/3347_1 /TAXON_ID=124430 /ORGANISM="Phaeomonas parva, Strain CCMP2877" /LENGTH=157 /DNA_ID=CAMNT_0006788521 /DNA_START=303 /DNA_END=776 /DNA_ORIENTATION=+
MDEKLGAKYDEDVKGGADKGEYDDDRTLELATEEFAPPRSPGLTLDIMTAQRKTLDGENDDYIVEDKITLQQETPVRVVFELPDGSVDEHDFLMGQTVLFLKSYIESEYDIGMERQSLYLNGELMLDPLSLLDFPHLDPHEEVYVVVEGEMGDAARK